MSDEFLQTYLQTVDGFSDHDIGFCLSIGESYVNTNSENPEKQMHYFKDENKKDLI